MRRPFLNCFQHVTSLAVIFVSLLRLSALVSAQNFTKKICHTKQCLSAAQNLKESINFKVNPCDDFYEYACGNWPNVHGNQNSIYGSTFQLREDENTAELQEFLKQNNSEDEPEAVHKARQLYTLCLNEAAYSNKLEQIKTILHEIGLPVHSLLHGENKNYDYTLALVKAAKLAGIKMFFDLTTGSNPYNQTINMIALNKISTSELDSTIMPLTRRQVQPILTNIRIDRSKPAEENISVHQFIAEMISRMCDDSASTYCMQWNLLGNTAKDIFIEKILTQQIEIEKIVEKATSVLNSSHLPVIYSLKQLQDLTDSIAIEVNTTIPKLNWTRHIEEMFSGLNNVTLDLSDPTKVQIAIQSLESIKETTRFIYERKSVKILEIALWLEVVYKLLPYVDLKIFDTKNKINNSGYAASRERRCTEITQLSFGMALSYAYAAKEKYIKAKTDIREMFDHIRDSFKQIIQEVPWMDETTRHRAQEKLQSIKPYIVYPNSIEAINQLTDFYQGVKISSNFYDTMITKIQNHVKKKLNQLNKTNEQNKDDWIITPNIVNALYSPDKNSIIIPAGILGLSIFNSSLRALDYGAIGSIIGHELTHAFDNTGRRYNELGNIENWWQSETSNSYREKARCFVKVYGNYSTNFGGFLQKADSKATLGEDISDSGGFKESLFAYRKSILKFGEEPILPQFENFTHEQLFTIAFANVWCESPTNLSSMRAEFNEHSPNGVRVNGVLQNSKEFAEIWKCRRGSNMNPYSDKCSVW